MRWIQRLHSHTHVHTRLSYIHACIEGLVTSSAVADRQCRGMSFPQILLAENTVPPSNILKIEKNNTKVGIKCNFRDAKMLWNMSGRRLHPGPQ